MSQRETSEVDVEWIVGVIGRQAHILMEGDAGTLLLEGVTVDINGTLVINGVPFVAGGGPTTVQLAAAQPLTGAYVDSLLVIPIAANATRILHAMLTYSGITAGQAAFAQHTVPAGLTGPLANIYRSAGAGTVSDSTLDETSQLNFTVVGASGKSAIFVYDAIFKNAGVAGNIVVQVKSLNGTGQLDAGSFVTYI